MSISTQISWTDCTDNIITCVGGGWWCRKVSAGCDNCYAATLNQNSFFGGNKLDYSGQPPHLILKRNILQSWARQTKPKKHFVASMTDIFGEWVDRAWHFEILDAMWGAPKQTFQLLTKRPHIMRDACLQWMKNWGLPRMPDNIWLGTTVENQAVADRRIPILLEIPSVVRFLSCEPLLERINLSLCLGSWDVDYDEDKGIANPVFQPADTMIDWVIIGGESGHNARPCHIDWMRSLLHQCQEAGVAAFVKQLGSNCIGFSPYIDGIATCNYQIKTSDNKGSNIAEFPEYLQIRSFPKS